MKKLLAPLVAVWVCTVGGSPGVAKAPPSPKARVARLDVRGALKKTIRYCAPRKPCKRMMHTSKPALVHQASISPDGRHAMVWFSPDKRARRLALFSLSPLKRLVAFVPGFGGTLRWTSRSRLVHHWGCGTSCANLRIYDVRGRIVFSLFSNGLSMSPSGRYAIVFPAAWTMTKGPRIWDLFLRHPKAVLKLPRGDYSKMDFDVKKGSFEAKWRDPQERPGQLTRRLPGV